jgi:hypothetical protein
MSTYMIYTLIIVLGCAQNVAQTWYDGAWMTIYYQLSKNGNYYISLSPYDQLYYIYVK